MNERRIIVQFNLLGKDERFCKLTKSLAGNRQMAIGLLIQLAHIVSCPKFDNGSNEFDEIYCRKMRILIGDKALVKLVKSKFLILKAHSLVFDVYPIISVWEKKEG
jgi:hypothetical protein